MHIKIISAIFDWISKQQVSLSLFLSDRDCTNVGADRFYWILASMKDISEHIKNIAVFFNNL